MKPTVPQVLVRELPDGRALGLVELVPPVPHGVREQGVRRHLHVQGTIRARQSGGRADDGGEVGGAGGRARGTLAPCAFQGLEEGDGLLALGLGGGRVLRDARGAHDHLGELLGHGGCCFLVGVACWRAVKAAALSARAPARQGRFALPPLSDLRPRPPGCGAAC